MTDVFTKAKPALASSGIWGSLIALGASVVAALPGLLSDPTVLAALPASAMPIIGALGAALALYGRITADAKIKGVVTSSPSV